ncbi:MAG: hypothetical protein AB1486_12430 [Planctomycetota bacterium]
MADEVTVDEVAQAMYDQVKAATGLKKLKPGDLSKMMVEKYGDRVSKQTCKDAIRQLIESGKCVYTYFGGSYVELPHKEGAQN